MVKNAAGEFVLSEPEDGAGTIAIVYDTWFDRFAVLPPQWVRCGRWTIANSIVTGSDVVSFYAVNSSASADLTAHLTKFTAALPRDVGHHGY